MRIDTHHHATPPRVISLFQREPLYDVQISGDQWKGGDEFSSYSFPPSMIDPAAKLRELDQKELDVAVICAPKSICYYNLNPDAGEFITRETNLGFEEFCSYDPKRLKWLAQLPLQAPERSGAVLRDAVAHGCSGVHVGTSIAGRRLDEPDFEPFWVAVEATDMTVFVHPMYAHDVPGYRDYLLTGLVAFPMEVTLCAERLMLSGVLVRHPRARVHLALGGGFLPYQIGRLRMFRSRYLDETPPAPWDLIGQITVDTHVTDVKALRFLIEQVGVENAVLGTDSPFDLSNPDPIGELRLATDGNEAVIRQVSETNPARLFHIDG